MKRLFMVSAVSMIPMFTAFASEAPKAKLGGVLDTQYGVIDQKSAFKYEGFSMQPQNKHTQHGFVNEAKIDFNIDGKSDSGIKYGGLIRINANTSKAANGSEFAGDKNMVYIENNFGRLEGGAYDSGMKVIRVSANSIGAATGGIDGDFSNWITSLAYDPNFSDPSTPVVAGNFIDLSSLFVNAPYLILGNDHNSRANKLTYYTPTIEGFRFAISYTPDIGRTGTVNSFNQAPHGVGYTQIIEAGAQYSIDIQKDWKIQTSILTELGKAKDAIEYITLNTIKRHNLRSLEVGASASYKGFSVGGSYGNIGKSGTTKTPQPGKKYGGSMWTLGAGYEYDKINASITYMHSKRAGAVKNLVKVDGAPTYALPQYFNESSYNTADIVSLGANYTLVPGLIPYVEYTHFKYSRKANGGVANSGGLILVGTKLKF